MLNINFSGANTEGWRGRRRPPPRLNLHILSFLTIFKYRNANKIPPLNLTQCIHLCVAFIFNYLCLGPVLPGRVQICRRLHTEEGQEEVPGPRSSGRSSP